MTTQANLKDLACTRLLMIIESCRKASKSIHRGHYEDASTDMKMISASLNTAAGCLGRLMVSEPKIK